jgi:exonuclease SbcC
MRIKRVHIGAFGPFTDKTLDMGPGMTVIVGDNESGKTTWHSAIYAALCGMRRGAGRRSEDRDFIDRHRPWDGDSWSVDSTLELSDGRQVEITQDLDGRVDCRAVDVGLGRRDVSSEIMFEGSPDASRWLGLDRRTFLATACVNQAEVSLVVNSAAELQEHLQRAAATAGADETAARALALIEEFKREQVGLDRANSTKPLHRAITRAADAEKSLEDANRTHEQYLVQLEAVEHLDSEAESARRKLDLIKAAAAFRDARHANARAERGRALATELQGEQIDLEALQSATDRVSGAIATWNAAPEPAPLTGPASADLERELSALPPAPIGELSPAAALVGAETAWGAARKAVEAHSAAMPPQPRPAPTSLSASELHELARDLSVTVPAVDPALEATHEDLERRLSTMPERRVSVPLLLAAGAVAVIAVGVGLSTTPVVLIVGLVVGAGLVVLAVRDSGRDPRAPLLARLQENESRLNQARLAADAAGSTVNTAVARTAASGLPPDPARLLTLATEVEQVSAATERRRQWEAANTQHLRTADLAVSALRAALTDRGYANAVDLDNAVREYREACTARARIAEQAARRPQLERELETRRHAEIAADDAKKRHAAAGDGLSEAARSVGLAAGDPNTTLGALDMWQEANRERLSLGERQARVRGELDTLLAERTLADLVTQAEEARRRAEAVIADQPRDEMAALAEAPSLDGEMASARADVESAHVAEAAARGELKQLSGASASVSTAEEALAAATAELERVRRLNATLSRTYEFLQDAQERVHRDIAPVLEQTLREWLPSVTAGRYTDASVDPELLGVKVKDPAGKFREAGLLSQGTLEQIYLLLRMALVAHLTKPGETSPLLFDDVTVQTDSTRTRAILDLLHEISRERQVIVFSQEEDVRHWAQDRLDRPADGLLKLELGLLTTLPGNQRDAQGSPVI